MSTQIFTSQSAQIDQFGESVSRRLTEGLDDLPHDITERLRAARMRAVANRQVVLQKAPAVAPSVQMNGDGTVTLGHDDGIDGWWARLGAALPLLALIVGLIAIVVIQDELSARELAEVDTELLTDDLPPSAYVDPGFVQFVRNNRMNQ